MPAPEITVTSRISLLEPGMWVFRYFDFTGSQLAPPVSLSPSILGNGSIDFFPSEGISKNTLAKLGDSIIVRIEGAKAGVLVTEYHIKGQQSQVKLRLDRISTQPTPHGEPQSNNQANPIQAKRPNQTQNPQTPTTAGLEMELMGHIERKGDVRVRNSWLGDPNSRNRLEGFAVSSPNLPEGLSFGYSCAGPHDTQAQAAISGNFIGSRQKAKPIVRVAFNTGGPKSSDYLLGGEVAFAGCTPTPITPGVEITGPTGKEPLVALRIQIAPKASNQATSSPWDDPEITKIFKNI